MCRTFPASFLWTYGGADNDTLFFFNYRSDRMREIVSVFGLPDKPMEVKVPKDLVSHTSKPTGMFLMFDEYRGSQRCRGTMPSSPFR